VSIAPNVAHGSLGDIPRCRGQVRFAPQSGICQRDWHVRFVSDSDMVRIERLGYVCGGSAIAEGFDIAQRQACEHSVVS
jgi:hypothetical protein